MSDELYDEEFDVLTEIKQKRQLKLKQREFIKELSKKRLSKHEMDELLGGVEAL